MGFASYLENILERLNRDLVHPTKRWLAENEKELPSRLRDQLAEFMRRCQQMESDLHEHLKLATDPQMDLAHEVRTLRRDKEMSQQRIKTLEHELRQLKKDHERFLDLNEQNSQLKKELQRAQTAKRDAEQQCKLMASSNDEVGELYGKNELRSRRGGLSP